MRCPSETQQMHARGFAYASAVFERLIYAPRPCAERTSPRVATSLNAIDAQRVAARTEKENSRCPPEFFRPRAARRERNGQRRGSLEFRVGQTRTRCQATSSSLIKQALAQFRQTMNPADLSLSNGSARRWTGPRRPIRETGRPSPRNEETRKKSVNAHRRGRSRARTSAGSSLNASQPVPPGVRVVRSLIGRAISRGAAAA